MNKQELQIAFDLHYQSIFTMCFNFLKHRENAEDIALSAFAEVCNRLDSIEFDKVKGFLIIVAKGKVVDLQRRNKVWKKITNRLTVEEPATIMHNQFDANGLLKNIDLLPPQMRQAIKLIYFEGYNRKEVAKITGKSENTVRNTVVAAIKHLKKRYETQ